MDDARLTMSGAPPPQMLPLFRRRFAHLAKWLAAASLSLLVLLVGDTPDAPGAGFIPVFSTSNGTIRFDLTELAQARALAATVDVTYLDVSRERAQAINAAIPFSALPNPAARPFRLGGDAQSQARALDCLAAAQYYEAGADWEGQRAVAQVVLNRARHPAYPASVCGVVFQGAERRTGCQFTFTCDGSLARRPVGWAWERTLEIARAALGGAVYAKVGLATHYHTDWVVPAWSGELEKITAVNTHLFFRWPGGWGQPRAFRTAASEVEPLVAYLAHISEHHSAAPGAAEIAAELALIEDAPMPLMPDDPASPALVVPDLAGVNLRGSQLRLAHPDGDAFGFLLPRDLPGAYGLLAYDVCAGRSFCKVMGWLDPAAIPRGFPVPQAAQDSMAFLYFYDAERRREVMAWNCDLFPRDDPQQCLTSDLTRWDALGN